MERTRALILVGQHDMQVEFERSLSKVMSEILLASRLRIASTKSISEGTLLAIYLTQSGRSAGNMCLLLSADQSNAPGNIDFSEGG